jgi:uncharacterized protein YacL
MVGELQLAVQEIAKQLGIASDKIYPVLLKQTKVEAVWATLMAIIFLTLTVLAIKYIVTKYKQIEEKKHDHCDYFISYLLSSLVLLISLTIGLCTLYNALGYIFNPEFMVLDYVLNMIN